MTLMQKLIGTLGIVLFASSSPAFAGEIQVALGAGGGASTWSADPIGHTMATFGYRFRDLASLNLTARLGYGGVDERLITELSGGGTLYGRLGITRPNLRLALVHQHEEPWPSIEADPVGSSFGVGDGIRHRYGALAQAGIDIPFAVTNGRAEWILGASVASSVFVDDRGPRSYVYGGLSLGVNYDL